MNRYPPAADFSELISLLQETKKLLTAPASYYNGSLWRNPAESHKELDELIDSLRSDCYPHSSNFGLFTHPESIVQEMSVAGGWESEYLQLSTKFMRAIPKLQIGESDRIYDIWFTSGLQLEEIADNLGLKNIEADAEDYWEWVIGRCGNVRLDITRTHTLPPYATATRIFVLPGLSFSRDLCSGLVTSLHRFADGAIFCGVHCDEKFVEHERFYDRPAIDVSEATSIALKFAREYWGAVGELSVSKTEFLTHEVIRGAMGEYIDPARRERVISRMPEQWWIWISFEFRGSIRKEAIQVNPDTKEATYDNYKL